MNDVDNLQNEFTSLIETVGADYGVTVSLNDVTVAMVVDTLDDNQRYDLYYVVGYALEKGKRYKCIRKYKDLTASLDDIQMKAFEYLLSEAIRAYKLTEGV